MFIQAYAPLRAYALIPVRFTCFLSMRPCPAPMRPSPCAHAGGIIANLRAQQGQGGAAGPVERGGGFSGFSTGVSEDARGGGQKVCAAEQKGGRVFTWRNTICHNS